MTARDDMAGLVAEAREYAIEAAASGCGLTEAPAQFFDAVALALTTSRSREAGEWRTIDSAPKGKARFLAYIKHGPFWQTVIAHWGGNGVLYDTRQESCVGWDPRGEEGRKPENRPFWMPLPAPPALEGKK